MRTHSAKDDAALTRLPIPTAQLWDHRTLQCYDLLYGAPAYHQFSYLGEDNNKADSAIPFRRDAEPGGSLTVPEPEGLGRWSF